MTPSPSLSDRLRQAMAASASGDSDTAIALFRQAVDEETGSPLAPFLLGAEFAQLGRIEESIQAYAAAVLLAPDFHIARYQMGLLQFTSGHAALALVTWQPLFLLPEDQPLRAFATAFAALADDRFDDALHHFRAGQGLNTDNAPLNADIQLVIDRIEALDRTPPPAKPAAPAEDASHVLLSNYRGSIHGRADVASMTPINAAAAVAQFIRQQSIGLRGPANAPAQTGKPAARKTRGSGGHDVASLVFHRIRFIEPTDPDRRRKAFRIFIESVLLFELGADLINDPKFYELVNEVESRMRGEPTLIRAIDEAADRLLELPSEG